MLGKAASQGIVLGYTSLCKAYDNLANHEVPYFPGDAVPIVLGKVASRNRMVRSKVKCFHQFESIEG